MANVRIVKLCCPLNHYLSFSYIKGFIASLMIYIVALFIVFTVDILVDINKFNRYFNHTTMTHKKKELHLL